MTIGTNLKEDESSTIMTGYSGTTYNDQQSNIGISSQAISYKHSSINSPPPHSLHTEIPVDTSVLGQLKRAEQQHEIKEENMESDKQCLDREQRVKKERMNY